VPERYVPERGDLVWLNFHPQRGHEQQGRRPAVVVSPRIYNQRSGLALFCPITSKTKDYPFEVQLPENCTIQGAILSDQLKSLDWKMRDADFICRCGSATLHELLAKVKTLTE